MPVSSGRSHFGGILVLLTFLLAPLLVHAQSVVGKIEFVQGLASAQNGTAAPRFLNKGDAIFESDVISTSARGFAIIAFADGSKMTLRPNTIFAVDKFVQTKGSESAAFRLLKGGFRAITGAIGRANPQGVQINTATATIGIRGTSFDTRICETDCAKELRPGQKSKPPAAQVVGRVALHSGVSTVVDAKGQSRAVTQGTPLFSGETVRTEKGAWAVLAFRDQSKVTVISESEFKLEDVRFSGVRSDTGSFTVRVLRGGARALTGLLGKREPAAVKFNAATVYIGLRGTGFDHRIALDCVAPGNCAQAVFAYTWEGAIALESGQQSLVVPLGRAGIANPDQNKLALLDKVPQFFLDEAAPRPDTVNVDFENLFATNNVDGAPAGVYASVRDGHIHFAGRKSGIDLGPGESGYLADGQDTPMRLSNTPRFLSEDPIPAPEEFNEKTLRLLEILNPGGNPGDVICEM